MYIFGHLEYFVFFGTLFAVLVSCTKKNLAALLETDSGNGRSAIAN
jgi:hypothetical protein